MALQSLLPPARLSGWSPLTEGAAHLPSPPPGGSCLSPPPALQGSPAAGGSLGAGNTPSEFHSGNYPAAKRWVLWRRTRPRLEAPRGLLLPDPAQQGPHGHVPNLLIPSPAGGRILRGVPNSAPGQLLPHGTPTGPPRDRGSPSHGLTSCMCWARKQPRDSRPRGLLRRDCDRAEGWGERAGGHKPQRDRAEGRRALKAQERLPPARPQPPWAQDPRAQPSLVPTGWQRPHQDAGDSTAPRGDK